MDATPIRVGQVFAGYAAQAEYAVMRAERALKRLQENMPIGGTAVGTGINTHPEFAGQRVRRAVATSSGIEFTEAAQPPRGPGGQGFVRRGPRRIEDDRRVALQNRQRHSATSAAGRGAALFELSLPAIQPGSSIMPGKVNPVICESVMQVACRVIGNDAVVTTAGLGGVGSLFELNVAMPVMIDAFWNRSSCWPTSSNVFVDKLLAGLEVNEDRCRELIDQSLMMVTSLAPKIGYEQAAALAKEAFKSGKTIRELCREKKILPEAELDRRPRSLENDRAAGVS